MSVLSLRLFILSFFLMIPFTAELPADPIRVLVWDEEQPGQRPTYPNFIGKHIAEHLKKNSALVVTTARLDDPDHGLSTASLENCDVLVWWGHIRHPEVPDAKAEEIADRIEAGELSMMTLHSAHWAAPFMAAMERRAAQDAIERLSEKDRARAKVEFKGVRERKIPARDARVYLESEYVLENDGSILIKLDRPDCVFPLCCHPVEPSLMRTLLPEHPIARGVPETFTLTYTEMYDGPYGVPPADQLIFSESWADGEHFLESGALWNVGRGQVFYLRPGHETYRVYYDRNILRVIDNAAVYLGQQIRLTK